MNFSHTSSEFLRFMGWSSNAFLSHKTANVVYLKLTFYHTAVHNWHKFGDFSAVPSFAKNCCMIWHNAQQIAVSLWGTTDGNWKSNSNNWSSTFGDLEWGMAQVYKKPVCYKSLLRSLLNQPRMYSIRTWQIADDNQGTWHTVVWIMTRKAGYSSWGPTSEEKRSKRLKDHEIAEDILAVSICRLFLGDSSIWNRVAMSNACTNILWFCPPQNSASQISKKKIAYSTGFPMTAIFITLKWKHVFKII